jgi:hypothetical protein
MSNPNEVPEPPTAEQPSERAALAVRPCARNIHAALKRANLTVKGVRVTTGGRRCRVDLTATLEEYGQERSRQAEQVIRRLWNDHEARVITVAYGEYAHVLIISVGHYWHTAPLDLVELCHAAALQEDEERTPAPVVASAEFPAGLRLRNPQTGASFEVIEHTHAVRLRNLRTDAVSAVPQDMAREFERLPAEEPQDRLEDIRARHRREDAARFEAALREGMVAVVRTVEALAPALLSFARNASAAAAGLAEAFGVPHPNACALCGQGEGPRDHWGGHDYRPPVDVIRLRRMQLRRTAGYPSRERIHAAHVKWRRSVNLRLLHERLEREAPYWTERSELERAGLTEVPFDQQRVQPDASAYSLPS